MATTPAHEACVHPAVRHDHSKQHDRMQITFQWLWTGEHKAADAPFSPDRIGRISLRKLLNEPPHVCGMYLVALRHFCVDLARAAPKHAVVIDSMFGEYDPIAH